MCSLELSFIEEPTVLVDNNNRVSNNLLQVCEQQPAASVFASAVSYCRGHSVSLF